MTMPPLWQILLAPFAIIISALIFEANIWLIYGLMTFREGKFTRRAFRLCRTLALLLMAGALIAPWFVLIFAGLWWANMAWIAGSLGTLVFIYAMGRFIEWRVGWFFDVARDRHALRKIADRKEKMFQMMIAQWDEMPAVDRRKFLQHYISYPLHMREIFFFRLLDSFPIADRALLGEKATETVRAERIKHWAGAHLFSHIDALLEVRHDLSEAGIFRGALPDAPVDRVHPEVEGHVVFARVGDDDFVVGSAS
jgi:hypothetical protein